MSRSLFLFFLLITSSAWAQSLAIGMYEGLMAGSGVAISESTAPSMYNPSLLQDRVKNSFVFGGNNFASYTSKSEGSTFSSAKVSPSYLSQVQVFDSYIHEFFLANLFSIDSTVITDSGTTNSQINLRLDIYRAGYSFAFRDFPMGFQVALDYGEGKTYGSVESNEATSKSISRLSSEYKNAALVGALSAHHDFGKYRFGYKYTSRQLSLVKKQSGESKKTTYLPGTQQYLTSSEPYGGVTYQFVGQQFSLGHSFRAGDHEFLTDSNFNERSDLDSGYTWVQTFGYRMNSSSQTQFLCGVSQALGSGVRYLGQMGTYSVGMSWKNRAQRTSVGLYNYTDRRSAETLVYGLTLNSEFEY